MTRKCRSSILNLYSESDGLSLPLEVNPRCPLRTGPAGCFQITSEINCVSGFPSLPVNPSSSLSLLPFMTQRNKQRDGCCCSAPCGFTPHLNACSLVACCTCLSCYSCCCCLSLLVLLRAWQGIQSTVQLISPLCHLPAAT